MKQRISTYHWLTVVTGLMMLTISNGLVNSALPIFDEPLLKEFGWSRGELKFREFVTSAVAAALVFFSGALIDKFGAKRLMLIGSVFLASGYALYGQLTSKYQMYAIHILLATALVSAGTIATIVLISSWFKARRGLALGIALVGTSMGGLVFPKPLTMLIASYGWRDTMLMLAVLPILFFIWTFFLVRNTPQERGLTPIRNTDDNAAAAPNLLASGLTYAEATRTVMFWLIAACGMFTFYSVVGLLSNTFLYMRDLGYDTGKAALALSYFSLLSMTGKFLISSISDYISPYRVFAICCTGMCIGSLGYTLMNADLIWFTIPITALCWGGMYTLYNLITVKSFGLKATGKINGTISILESAGAALGPWLTGVLYDKTGSYQAGFMVISVMLACCSLVSYRFGKYALKEI